MENTKTQFYKKISELQTHLKVKKENKNNFGGYNYRSFEDICAIVKQNLNGLVLYVNDELIHEGDRFYIKATATITDGENSITNSSLAREEEAKKGMDGAQVTGGASSYARKYALSGLLLLENEKDSDATNQHNKKYVNTPEKSQNNTQKKASEKQIKIIKKNKLHDNPDSLSSSDANAIISKFMEDKNKPKNNELNSANKEQFIDLCKTIDGLNKDSLFELAPSLINECNQDYREELRAYANNKAKALD
jgi:hypothetical protein